MTLKTLEETIPDLLVVDGRIKDVPDNIAYLRNAELSHVPLCVKYGEESYLFRSTYASACEGVFVHLVGSESGYVCFRLDDFAEHIASCATHELDVSAEDWLETQARIGTFVFNHPLLMKPDTHNG